MTCEECEQILLDCMLRTSRAVLVQAHVQNCSTCTTRMAEVLKVENALEELRVSAMHLEASAAVERNLVAAFRRETGRRRLSFGDAFPWRLVWVSAATLVLAVAGILYSRLRPDFLVKVENNRIGNNVEIQPPFSPGRSRSTAEAPKGSRRPAPENGVSGKNHAAKAIRTMPEPVAQRPPIPVSDELSLNGGGSIVRVTLPFSSLTAMGLPVRPDLSDNRVTADVWVDPFGAVVGIRLVPSKASAD